MAGHLSKPDKSGQFARLQALLAPVSQTNLFYAGKLRRAGYMAGLEEFFERMPFTRKQELIEDQRANPPFGSNLTYPIERYTRLWQTSSTTGLRAVASLVSECKQMAKREPDVYPVIELAVGAFEHKDPRVGTVKKPAFKIVGKVSRTGLEPPQIGAAAVLNDEIPW